MKIEQEKTQYSTRLLLECNIGNVERLATEIDNMADRYSADSSEVMKLQRACEERFSNIVFYAFDGAEGAPISVDIYCDAGNAQICFRDKGKPFDPLTHEDPDVDQPLDDREIGGLGIFLVRKTMDSVTYEREGDENVLTLHKNIIHQ